MAKFLALLYTYLNISITKNIVPDEIKGREIHHSFPMTLFQVMLLISYSFLTQQHGTLTLTIEIRGVYFSIFTFE